MDASKIAYSYIRFSSKPQADGGSFERQKDRAEIYAETHGLTVGSRITTTKPFLPSWTECQKGTPTGFLGPHSGREARPGSTLIVEKLWTVFHVPKCCNRWAFFPRYSQLE